MPLPCQVSWQRPGLVAIARLPQVGARSHRLCSGGATDGAAPRAGDAGANIDAATAPPASVDNAIVGNFISDNGGLGIDLDGGRAVDTNDPGDTDSGPNDLLNYPVIMTVSHDGTDATVTYALDVMAGNYRVEFFRNFAADPSGHGEANIPWQANTVSHAGAGPEVFVATVPVSAGALLSATCTEDLGGGQHGSTSEPSLTVPTTYP